MTPYIYIHTNKFSRWFLLRYLKKKGYTFRNNMTQEHILIHPYGRYAFCMCEKIIAYEQVWTWVILSSIFK